jgi:histidinol phosphatase-like enzyme (inositol monophosphatase family)
MDSPPSPAFLDVLADAAAAVILPLFRTRLSVEDKGRTGFDPVTLADRSAEAAMRKLIGEHYPKHGIVGEEYGREREDAEFVWVLDPIDGTRSFITGLPLWGVLIGLLRNGNPILGMMAQPFTGERFAGDGTHAWLANKGGRQVLATRPCDSLAGAALLTTTPFLFAAGDREAYRRVESTVRLARYGTDCYGYCMVAAGHADLVIESGLQPYDIVALIPIIAGAGGRVTTWDGGSAAAGGRIVASGDGRLHDIVLERLAGG